MIILTSPQLSAIMPLAGQVKIATFLDPINATLKEFDIGTPLRVAAFLAQIGHESGQLRYVRELASGAAYEGRKDLGNNSPGDGVRYKGRGLIQITGKVNYIALAMALDINCIVAPEILEQPVNACRSAGWFWKCKGLNALADKGDFKTITLRINGGYNGLQERETLYAKAKLVLGIVDNRVSTRPM